MSPLKIKCFWLESWVGWIEKWGSTLSHESSWINTWGIHLSHELNLFKPLRYSLSHELIRMKAIESNAQKRSYKCNTWVKSPKRSTNLSESPKKVNEIYSWFESLSHELIRINIPDSLSLESIWIKILESVLSRELNWIKVFWKFFLSRESIWINILEIHFESWADLHQFL